MKLNTASTLGFIATSLMAIAAPAQAFTGFGFTANYTQNPSQPTTGNITLNSVTFGSKTLGQSDLSLVTRASVLRNSTITHGHSAVGVASADRGDSASGINEEEANDINVVTALGNFNLNNIIDTEDRYSSDDVANGSDIAEINVFFGKAVNHFFLAERGMNSDLKVEAIDEAGQVINDIATETILRGDWAAAGYSINTTEIERDQSVGFRGLRTNRLIAGLRLSSNRSMNGPDYKVFAARVPEPATMAGLALVTGAAVLSRRGRKMRVQRAAAK
jgi:hypothetical protein